jgi:hypothetical protein
MPQPGSVGGRTATMVGGDRWVVLSETRWWGEAHAVGTGWQAALPRDAEGRVMSVSFPAFCGATDVIDLISVDSGDVRQVCVRSSGWPWRTWLRINAYHVNSRTWDEHTSRRWLPALASVGVFILPVWLLATVASHAWTTARSGFRRRRGLCSACGYDMRNLAPTTAVCPECGDDTRARRHA